MSMSEDGPVEPSGSPPNGLAGFADAKVLLAMAADPAAFAARVAELERLVQAASAKLARAEKAWAAVEVKRGEVEAWAAAERAEIEKARAALAKRVGEHEFAVSEWRARCEAIETDAARWRRQFDVGVDASNPAAVRNFTSERRGKTLGGGCRRGSRLLRRRRWLRVRGFRPPRR